MFYWFSLKVTLKIGLSLPGNLIFCFKNKDVEVKSPSLAFREKLLTGQGRDLQGQNCKAVDD